jgi:hypothetical protein
MVCVTALKAAGESRRVVQAGVLRLAMLAAALAASLPHGVEAVAAAVLGARAAAMLASLALSRRLLGQPEGEGVEPLAAAAWCFGLWISAYLVVVLFLREHLAGTPWKTLSIGICVALALWVCARWSVDRAALRREFASVSRRAMQLARGRG